MAELGDEPADPIEGSRVLFDEALAHPLHCKIRLLLDCLHRYKAHVRPRDSLADRLRIVTVVLAAFALRGHELRRHQLHCVAETAKSARPLVRSRASLHADQARWQLRYQLRELVPGDRATHHHRALGIHAVHAKGVLYQVDSKRRN